MGKTISVHFDYPVDELEEDFNLSIDGDNMLRVSEDAEEISSALWELADDALREMLRYQYDAKRR